MNRKISRLVLVFVLVGVLGSTTFGLTPMGSPLPDLNKGQFDVGVDYSYTKMDIKINHGFSPGGGPSRTIENLKTHYIGANIGYGLTDNWQWAIKIGGGSIRGKESGGVSFNSNDGYAIGFATKAKLFECKELEWGGLFQVLWVQADGKTKAGGSSWSAEENLMEIQIALGPEYRMNEKTVLYGGPFWHILDGDFVAKDRAAARRIKYDIDQSGTFGGYIGAGIDVMKNAVFNIEYQHTGGANSIGMKLAYKF